MFEFPLLCVYLFSCDKHKKEIEEFISNLKNTLNDIDIKKED